MPLTPKSVAVALLLLGGASAAAAPLSRYAWNAGTVAARWSAEDEGEATRRFEARRSILLASMREAAGLADETVAALDESLGAALLSRLQSAKQSGREVDSAWAARAFAAEVEGQAWRTLLNDRLSAGEQEAIQQAASAADAALLAAQARLATVMTAAELRLRAPQVLKLRAGIDRWLLEDRTPTRSQELAGDVVAEVILVSDIRKWLLASHVSIPSRMRSAKQSDTPATDAPGDDLALGRGRYPEDDFVLEADSLALFHGWPDDQIELLKSAGLRLGRAARRSSGRAGRFGDVALFKARVDPSSSELWTSLVERTARELGSAGPDPGPEFTGATDVIVSARVDLLLALLELRVSLSEAQADGVRGALTDYVAREYVSRTRVFGALDPDAIWTELRFIEGKDPRRGSNSRKRLCEAMSEVLNASQAFELGIEE